MPYADPQAKAERAQEYREEHREELAAKQRDYYARNREARTAAAASYLARHPEMAKRIQYANSANKRAAHFGCEGKLYARDLRALRGPCAYCGGEQDTWDHVVPLSRGGSNSVENLVPCCEPCNRSKGRKRVEEWRS